jgi:hypothetical protein
MPDAVVSQQSQPGLREGQFIGASPAGQDARFLARRANKSVSS